MRTRIILYLIMKKFGLKKKELFRFVNQRSKNDAYYFTDKEIIKMEWQGNKYREYLERPSSVSLNWLLDECCEIKKVK